MNDFIDSQYYQPISGPLFRITLEGTGAFHLSMGSGRATCTNTGGIYCSRDVETALAEVSHLRDKKVTIWQLQVNSMSCLNLSSYCEAKGILPETCYAGEKDSSKSIYSFYGESAQTLSWPSQKRVTGTSMVLYPDNILNFYDRIKAGSIASITLS